MLDLNFWPSFLVFATNFASIILSGHLFDENQVFRPLTDSNGNKIYHNNHLLIRFTGFKENYEKVYLHMARESLYFVAIMTICYVMRPRFSYPRYFGWEPSVEPYRQGVAAFDGIT